MIFMLRLFFLSKTEEIASEEAALSQNRCGKTGNGCNQEFLKVQRHFPVCCFLAVCAQSSSLRKPGCSVEEFQTQMLKEDCASPV